MLKKKVTIHGSCAMFKRLPKWMSFIEAVRIGQDCESYVRVKVFGIDCGIWTWSKKRAEEGGSTAV